MINFVLACLAINCSPTGSDAQQAPPAALQASDAKPAGEPAIDVSLWFVSFDSKLAAGKLPLDVRSVAAEMGGRYPHAQSSDGRIPTWGLARQLQAHELEVVDGPYRLICRDGKLVSQSDKDRGGNAGPPPWQIVSSPRIIVALNQQGMVSVGRPIQFMTKQDDGCLKVDSAPDVTEGVELKLTASKILPEGIRFTGVSLKFSRVTGRQPIEGVPFDVGRPIIDTRETSLDITLDNGKLAVIPLPQGEGEPAILVFMTARVVEGTK